MAGSEGQGPGYSAEDLADIPGTPIFTVARSRKAYHLHRFCMALMTPAERDAFHADEAAYLDRFPMTDDQKAAVLARDYARLTALDGNIFFLVKLAFSDGWSTQQAVACIAGMDAQAYAAMMLAGGRSPDGLRSIREGR